MKNKKFKSSIKKRSFFSKRRFINLKPLLYKYTAFLLLGLTGYALFPRDITIPSLSLPGIKISKPNMIIEKIEIEGLDKALREDIIKSIHIQKGDDIFSFSPEEVKKSVEDIKWVAKANVYRQIPNRVVIAIEEERPKALYFYNHKYYYINDNGKIIDALHDLDEVHNYIIIRGKGGNKDFSDLLDKIYQSEEIYSQLAELIKVDSRRWDIKLKNGTIIKLPENNVSETLLKFESIHQNTELLNLAKNIDLRLSPNKLYIKIR